MPNIGETIYYRSDSRGWVQKSNLLGETSRSWLVGDSKEWWAKSPERIAQFASKLPKKTTVFETAEAYELAQWAHKNRYQIKTHIEFCSAEVLKKVAEIIGYKEEAGAR